MSIFYYIGRALRETGQALIRQSQRFNGDYSFMNQVNLHRNISPVANRLPKISENVFIANNATVIGDVSVKKGSSIWFGSVLRGDLSGISIGENTTIGDRTVLHTTKKRENILGTEDIPVIIGNNVLVGENCTLHACTVGDNVKIGSGSVILDGSVIEAGATIKPGSLISMGTIVKSGETWVGRPAKKSN